MPVAASYNAMYVSVHLTDSLLFIIARTVHNHVATKVSSMPKVSSTKVSSTCKCSTSEYSGDLSGKWNVLEILMTLDLHARQVDE